MTICAACDSGGMEISMKIVCRARARSRSGARTRNRYFCIPNSLTTKPDYDYAHEHDQIYPFIKLISTYIACRVRQKFESIFMTGCAHARKRARHGRLVNEITCF
jgi:hypothetical protein